MHGSVLEPLPHGRAALECAIQSVVTIDQDRQAIELGGEEIDTGDHRELLTSGFTDDFVVMPPMNRAALVLPHGLFLCHPQLLSPAIIAKNQTDLR